ncbi:hypothetical protein, partial [Staphylococcus capitis]|uniref:hypothetical protein n=1 Tax=Staphylococcus capitis TaxID=29388 RepID=UPI002040DECC
IMIPPTIGKVEYVWFELFGNCSGACAAHYSDNALQLHKIIEETNQINIRLVSHCMYIVSIELS